MITIQKTAKNHTVTRQEIFALEKTIEGIADKMKQKHLMRLMEKTVNVNFQEIRKPLQELVNTNILKFRIVNKHFSIISSKFLEYNIKVNYPTKKQKINTRVINQDVNHFIGRGR